MIDQPQVFQEQPKNSPADRVRPHRFRPGQSGNPGGRPAGSGNVLYALRRIAADPVEADRLARGLWEKAVAGNAEVARILFDRLYGPVTQQSVMLAGKLDANGMAKLPLPELLDLVQDLRHELAEARQIEAGQAGQTDQALTSGQPAPPDATGT